MSISQWICGTIVPNGSINTLFAHEIVLSQWHIVFIQFILKSDNKKLNGEIE